MNWSMQLYSARNFQPWTEVLKTLADAGYTEVEGFGGVYGDPVAFRAELDANGLSMPSGHFPIEMLENDFGKVAETAGILGMKQIVCPYIVAEARPADAAGWRQFAARLEAVGRTCRDSGYGFAWHNHDFEFRALADGSVPMVHILDGAPGIGWEIDVAWLIRGGSDPRTWIGGHADRIKLVHVKDIAAAGQGLDEDGWSDVGHGTVDWKGLIGFLRSRTKAEHYVMEQDNPNDFARFARRSIASVKAY